MVLFAVRTWASKWLIQYNSSTPFSSSTEDIGSRTTEVDLASRTAMLPINQVVCEQHSAIEGGSLDDSFCYNHPHARFIASPGRSTPIHRLPVELLLLIFHYGNPQIEERLRLTHVCRRWRIVMIENASLWTSIDIKHDPTAPNERFQNSISFLEMQLERTKASPLDVVWYICGPADRITVVMDLLQRKGPFDRWRTLTLSLVSVPQEIPSPVGQFSNLESLTVLDFHSHPILQTINLTTTSKLRTLNLPEYSTSSADVNRLYGAILKRITTLVGTLGISTMPTNITTIENERGVRHPFPHVRTYKLRYCFFRPDSAIDLQCLKTLIVTTHCRLQENCQLILPSLCHFLCASLYLASHAVLDAPLLETLHFLRYGSILDSRRSWPGAINAVLDQPGCLLNPSTSLSLDIPLPMDSIMKVITRYAYVEQLQLYLDSEEIVCGVTAALAVKGDENGFPCPQLTELRFKFGRDCRDLHGLEWWTGQATQIVEGRRCLASVPRIYGSWDDGDTYILLA